jgi:hypothetical protein
VRASSSPLGPPGTRDRDVCSVARCQHTHMGQERLAGEGTGASQHAAASGRASRSPCSSLLSPNLCNRPGVSVVHTPTDLHGGGGGQVLMLHEGKPLDRHRRGVARAIRGTRLAARKHLHATWQPAASPQHPFHTHVSDPHRAGRLTPLLSGGRSHFSWGWHQCATFDLAKYIKRRLL